MTLPSPSQFSIRLLLPFALAEQNGELLRERILDTALDGAGLWQDAELHEIYTDELLPQTTGFLFPVQAAPQHYFRVPGDILNRWFRSTVAVVPDGVKEEKARQAASGEPHRRRLSLPISLDEKYGIELFVLHQRVGVLSISFRKSKRPTQNSNFDFTAIRDLQYHLSQRGFRAPLFRIPHPALDDFAPPGERPLHHESPLGDCLEYRLGNGGQPFTLIELSSLLLSAITVVNQSQFLVHTVVRFPHGSNFLDTGARGPYFEELASLAQIDEPHHAPAALESLGVPCEALNANHLAAYSYIGAAHFVSDQWEPGGPSSFDDTRVERVQRKYFTAFLTTLAERFSAHKFLEETVATRLNNQTLTETWDRFTRFEAAAQLIDISNREPVNRCYRSAQRAQRIPETLASLHRIFRDAQVSEQFRRQGEILARHEQQAESQLKMLQQQNELARHQQQMLREQEETKHRLGLIEIFIVTVYTADLIHILGTSAEFEHLYVFAGVSLLSLLALITVLQHHRRVTSGAAPGRALLVCGLIALLLWIGGGFAWQVFGERFFGPVMNLRVPPPAPPKTPPTLEKR